MISSASLLALVLAGSGADSLPPALAARVEALVGHRWEVPASQVHLEWGSHPPLADELASASVRLGGSGQNGWFIVTLEPEAGRPIAITVRAGTLQTLVVATRPLAPGTRLAAGDFTTAERVAWGPPVEAVVVAGEGWEVRRALAAGAALVEPAVQPPRLVLSGDPVVFVWSRGAVRMERIAIAQGSARLGERVLARVGAVRLSGIVTGPRTAQIAQEIQP